MKNSKKVTEEMIESYFEDLEVTSDFLVFTYCVGRGKIIRFGAGTALCLHPDCSWCSGVREGLKKGLID